MNLAVTTTLATVLLTGGQDLLPGWTTINNKVNYLTTNNSVTTITTHSNLTASKRVTTHNTNVLDQTRILDLVAMAIIGTIIVTTLTSLALFFWGGVRAVNEAMQTPAPQKGEEEKLEELE